MNRLSTRRIAAGILIAAIATTATATAQDASLYPGTTAAGEQRVLTLHENSWTYQAPPPLKEVKLNDIITIVVDESSIVISEGEMDRKKKAHGDLILSDWIILKGFSAMFADPQSRGDPHVRGEIDNKYRAESGLETRESIKFRIACRVVDVRPNGNLILEGRRSIQNNSEVWDYSLTGEVRADDVQPNNTVLSENVAELRLNKREAGHVRDGYRRGWALRWLDKFQPF